MIYQTVYSDDFVQAFDDANRSENFSVQARRVLFDWLEDYCEDTGEDIMLDVIAICCDWAEYAPAEIVEQFGHLVDRMPGADDAEYFRALLCELLERGTILRVDQPVADDTYLFSECWHNASSL